jgi:hypothetical protein
VQEEGSLPEMQWRAPQAVCTSAARKIRVPLVARQRQSLSAGLVSLLCAERGYRCFSVRRGISREEEETLSKFCSLEDLR